MVDYANENKQFSNQLMQLIGLKRGHPTSMGRTRSTPSSMQISKALLRHSATDSHPTQRSSCHIYCFKIVVCMPCTPLRSSTVATDLPTRFANPTIIMAKRYVGLKTNPPAASQVCEASVASAMMGMDARHLELKSLLRH